jgi:hypothetical protein
VTVAALIGAARVSKRFPDFSELLKRCTKPKYEYRRNCVARIRTVPVRGSPFRRINIAVTPRSRVHIFQFLLILKAFSYRNALQYEFYMLQCNQGGCIREEKMPTAPAFFNLPEDSTNESQPAPPPSQKTAHLSGNFGRFVENKQDPPLFPLIMSGFDHRRPRIPLEASTFSQPEKLRSKPILPSQPEPPCPRLHAPTILTVYPGFQKL